MTQWINKKAQESKEIVELGRQVAKLKVWFCEDEVVDYLSKVYEVKRDSQFINIYTLKEEL